MNFCYAIKDWQKHFENSESRKVKSLTWVPVKNKHDGKGYRRVVQHPKSVQVFCAWNLILQVASKMPTRGLLRDEDGPLQPSDLADMTGFPLSIFEIAFEVLQDPRIAWLVMDGAENNRTPPDASGRAGVEGNGTELNGIKREMRSPDQPEANLPSWDEVKTYASMDGIPEAIAKAFFEHYEANNLWRNRHGLMINVRPSLKVWHNRNRQGIQNGNHRNRSVPQRIDRNIGTANEGIADQYKGVV